MEKDDIEEKKKKVLNEIMHTRKHIRSIARENNLSIEEVYAILEEYNRAQEIQRPGNISFQPMQKDETEEEIGKLYDKIYQLRKAKMSYKAISEKTGFSVYIIKEICKKIFDEKEEEITESSRKKWQTEEAKSLYDKIYQLRKAKMSYKAISEKTGFSVYIIKEICKKIFDEKEEEITESSRKKWQTEESKKIDEMIYNLVQQGKKYGEIKEELSTKGITMGNERIRQRYERKKLQTQKDLAKMILNLITTKKATLEQVQIIADYYGVDLEETINSLDER